MDNFDLKKFLSAKTLLTENAPGYDTRKQGEALPTLESVKAAYEAKNKIKENSDDFINPGNTIDQDKNREEYLRMMGEDLLKDEDDDFINPGNTIDQDKNREEYLRMMGLDFEDDEDEMFEAKLYKESRDMLPMENPKVDTIIQMLKDIDIDGETMEYILRQVGMDDQILNQLDHSAAFDDKFKGTTPDDINF